VSPPIVLSFGGGTNSVAILVEAVRRGLHIDAILFADTGGEMPETYRYLWELQPWLERHGLPSVTVVRGSFRGGDYTLEEHSLRLQRMPSKAYGRKSCSVRFKIQPQDKWRNSWAPAQEAWARGEKVVSITGYDADEPWRAKHKEDDKYTYSYPLIDWRMGREECAHAIMRAGIALPGKSACFYCPSSRPAEVAKLAASHPDLFGRGLAMEEAAAPTMRGAVRGLGSNFSWRSVGESVRTQAALPIARDIDDDCGCYDGARDADRILAPDYCGSFKSVVPLPRESSTDWPLARDWAGTTGPAWSQDELFGGTP